MRTLKQYAVRDAAGKLVRITQVTEEDAPAQAEFGGTVRLATVQDETEHTSQRNAIRALADALRAAAAAEPDQQEVLLDALKDKGLLTKADLAAATVRVRDERRGRT